MRQLYFWQPELTVIHVSSRGECDIEGLAPLMAFDVVSKVMEEFSVRLRTVHALKEAGNWVDAERAIVKGLLTLVKIPPAKYRHLDDTHLFAELIRGRPSFWIPFVRVMLIVLLKEAGDCATAKLPPFGGQGWYLRCLHQLLDTMAHEGLGGYDNLVPSPQELLQLLGNAPLPIRTRLLLMRHFERTTEFAKAKEQFSAALARSPTNQRLLKYGIAFFERVNSESDNALLSGGLPREQLDALLKGLRERVLEK